MKINEYKTGNPGTDRLIAKALEREQIEWRAQTTNERLATIKKQEELINALLPIEKNNKYNVAEKKERTKDGITFASKAEMDEDKNILLEVKAGKYWNLLRQPKFLLTRKKILDDGTVIAASFYVADWMYMDEKNIYVVDKKGFKTKEYILKKKMFLEKYQNFVFIER